MFAGITEALLGSSMAVLMRKYHNYAVSLQLKILVSKTEIVKMTPVLLPKGEKARALQR